MKGGKAKDIKTLKYPLRWLFQIFLISVIVIFSINFLNGTIKCEEPNNNYSLYFVLICFIELITIIYYLEIRLILRLIKEKKNT